FAEKICVKLCPGFGKSVEEKGGIAGQARNDGVGVRLVGAALAGACNDGMAVETHGRASPQGPCARLP
ncbi:MAG: hypothetical protein LBR06_01415, partial [Bacteroidales bacterium]|nr:hypothetical protein [Bacteroidales bacterium]